MRRRVTVLGLFVACLFVLPAVAAPPGFAADPKAVSSCTLPNPAGSVAVAGDHAYVAADWSGLQVVDISSPAAPVVAGSCSLSNETRALALVGTHVYATHDWDGLGVIDISTPTAPFLVGSYGLPSLAPALAAAGHYVYVAYNGLQIVDVASPTAPVLAGSCDVPGSSNVAVSGDHAYVTAGRSLQVVNVSTPTAPVVVGSCTLPDDPWALAVSGSFAYVSDSYGRLLVIDISTPATPTIAGSCILPHLGRGVAVVGTLAYVADGYSGLVVVDVGNAAAPVVDGSCPVPAEGDPDEAGSVAVTGRYAYVTGGFRLHVVDLTPPEITSLTPDHALPGATVVIAGSRLGSGGVVKFGETMAATSAWSDTSITCTVPAALGQGTTAVTVTPTGGATSNALAFEVAGTAAQLTGHLYALHGDYSMGAWQYWFAPASGATVTWWTGSSTGSGSTTTGSDGAYTLTGVRPATGDGVVQAAFRKDPEQAWKYTLAYTDRAWPDALTSTFDFRPGMATMQIKGGGPWFDGMNYPWVTMRGSDADGGVESSTIRPNVTFDRAFGLPGTYRAVCAYWYSNEGVEKPVDFTITAGAETATGMTFNETNAQRLWEVFAYSASGDPGTVVKLRMENFPAGEVTDFYGYQYEPVMTPHRSFGSYTAQAVTNQYKKVTIPSTARVGQDYVIGGQHRDGLLDLEVYFQVTRLKAPTSASGSYRLTGQVPIRGYDGSKGDTGTAKYVYLYRRYTSAAQPKGNPTKYGWKLVRRYRTDGTGRFTTYSMNPGRTAWYVVYYPGDRDNWDGFTSVRRVRHS